MSFYEDVADMMAVSIVSSHVPRDDILFLLHQRFPKEEDLIEDLYIMCFRLNDVLRMKGVASMAEDTREPVQKVWKRLQEIHTSRMQ
jgi:hypothetical protein